MRDLSDVDPYRETRLKELRQAADQDPDGVVRAGITLAAPLRPAEARALAEMAHIDPAYFEWRQVGTELRGADGWEFLEARAREYPRLGVTYMTGVGRLVDLNSAGGDRRVWLVDLGVQGNLFDSAVEAGLLPEP